MATPSNPRVFSIPSGCPFLPTLADALVDGTLVDGPADTEALGRATIYLPTRRAARALAVLLAERAGGQARILPRIVPLGEPDDFGFGDAGEEAGIADRADLAPPIAPLERRLILTRLVRHWSANVDRSLLNLGPGIPFRVPASPADAVNLAGDLEALMDSFTTEEVSWEDIASAVDAEYSQYFRLTLDFVRIAAEAWPKICAERGASDPARRRGALIAAEARRLLDERPETPIIAAGSTGSIPSTATLLAAIARLPNGAVVLPGLDADLDEAGWASIRPESVETDPTHGHPQALLKRLLTRYLRVDRSGVRGLGRPEAAAAARAYLLSQALRPADTTERWAELGAEGRLHLARRGAAGIAVVEAVDERDEALAAALALRETLEHPGRTAALVTPDRSLALRVTAELARWGIEVEDSAGTPLADTRAGRLARLAAEAAAQDFHPVRLLALLAHPDLRLGWPREQVERAAAALEIGVLRGPAPGPGFQGLKRALSASRGDLQHHAPKPRQRLKEEDWRLASLLLTRLEDAFEPFLRAAGARSDLVALATHHATALEILRHPGRGSEPAADPSSEALNALFDDLAVSHAGALDGSLADYTEFFAALAKMRALPPQARVSHRRVKILGLLEARLLSVDRMVLGGLDEGIWPPRTETDAFLNRPMRAAIGLTPPERRIGQTAHDLVQALGNPDVVITRAKKRDGAPQVPSRFLQRLKAFVGDEVWSGLVASGWRWRAYARSLETPAPTAPLRRPEPRPPAALIPRRLSVTQVETLIRDPYAIYARHVLGLDALDAIAGTPSPAERGSIIHALLARFVELHSSAMPSAEEALSFFAREGVAAFEPVRQLSPRLHAEWWPRFQDVATAFIAWETGRRRGLQKIEVEISGRLDLKLADDTCFALTARADRIETDSSGGVTLIDYKTGKPPTAKTVYAGFSPQLTLQAAMLAAGAFEGVQPVLDVPELVYIHTPGGRDPLRVLPLKPPNKQARPPDELVRDHLAKLTDLLSRYASGEAAFLSQPFPQYANSYSDYDHLARVSEWSAAPGEAPEEGA